MKHLSCITLPKRATIISNDPNEDGENLSGDDIVAIMESFFDFVFEYMEVKGKGAAA